MTKPPTHTLPADAFRADRGKTDAAGSMYGEPPEQVARRTIELRLSRLEDQTTTLIDRIERLEAWTRNEIFARTAMDEPDPDPVAADEAAKYEKVKHEMARAYANSINPIDAHGRSRDYFAGKAAVTKAVQLGLAVNPNDLIRTILDDQYEHPDGRFEDGYNRGLRKAARIIGSHINDRRGRVAKGGDGE